MALGIPGISSPGDVWPLPAYHKQLLSKARLAINHEQYQLAVVLAEAACEVRAEQAFDALYRHKGIETLAKPIRKMLPGYNLTNERVRQIYEALSGDHLRNAPFWTELKAHVHRRDRVVHRGVRVTREDAEASLTVARALTEHLDRVVRSLHAIAASSART